jgi:subtilase family serine protease
MIGRAFAEAAGVKPGGNDAAIRGRWSIRLAEHMLAAGRLAGGGFARLALAGAIAAALLPFTARAQGVGKQSLHGHVTPEVARFHLQPMSRLPATNRLNLAIGLPLRNQAALDKLLSEIYDPASTNYHRYLTPEQFTAQFGPAEQDYQSLIHFAQTNGLAVTATYPNRLLLDVSGNAATVEKVFHVTLSVYQHPTENRSFFAPDAEPSIDFDVPVLHVSGLDNFSIPRPASLKKNPLTNRSAGVAPAAGSGTGGSYMGKDFRAAYAPGVTLNGAGQMVGLVEFDGYYASDITAYEQQAGLPNIPLQNVLLDGFSGTPTTNVLAVFEVSLDIEMAISMATNLASVVVFEAGPSDKHFDDILNCMASSNQIKQFSSSWFLGGIASDTNANQVFQQMAVQGQSFFQASGDGDAWVNPIHDPAASPYVTCVGGTTLTMNGSGASYASETVWNLGYSPPAWSFNGNGYIGSGGGVSANYSIPSWQQGINMTTNQGSTTMRNIPDVALTADNIWVIYNNGQSVSSGGGTSAAAPLWAGFTALVNQQATNTLKPPVGFLNPAIYAIGKSPNYAAAFHDISTGNNFSAGSPTNYPAVPGYDLCTGWGTPNGTSLINALAPPDPLGISPASGFNASGPASGPFNPGSQIFFMTNSGAGSLTWSLINTSSWLNVSANSGTLAAGASNYVTISLTAAANNLAIGNYAATVNLTNWNTHVVQSLQFTLQAQQPLVVAPAAGFSATGPVAGPFSPNSGSFQLTNTGNASLTWSLINTSAWLTASGGGALAGSATTTATVSLNSAATNLAVGTYAANVWFTNQTGGGAQSRQFNLLVNQTLIQNGGFETGDFTGWTQSGNTADSTVSSSSQFAHSGTYGAKMGPGGSLGFLAQTLPTLAGQNYLLSLWLESPNIPGTLTPNEFSITWNGGTLFDQVNIGKIGWTNLQFIVTSASSNTVLQFGFQDDQYYLGLDDVSLAPIPAAAFQTTTVAATNNILKFTWNAMTGLVYQVQFKTNLLQSNWVVLKSITATNIAITFVDTNPITGSPQKFYRLLLLP